MTETLPATKAAAAKRGRKSGSKNKDGPTKYSRDVKLGLITSLNYAGRRWPEGIAPPDGVSPNAMNFWLSLKNRYPQKYAECLMKCIKTDDGAGTGDVQILIQQLTISGTPVPGVIASPIAEHVQPLRLVNADD